MQLIPPGGNQSLPGLKALLSPTIFRLLYMAASIAIAALSVGLFKQFNNRQETSR